MEWIHEIDMALLALRVMTSQIYRIYDPLGWLCLITIKFQLVLQELFQRRLMWDEPIPMDLDAKI